MVVNRTPDLPAGDAFEALLQVAAAETSSIFWIADEAGLSTSFALESEMACGFGVCLGCVVPAQDGRFATVCKEGPCLPHTAIDWSRV